MDETADDANAAVAAAVEVLTQTGVKAQGEVRTTIYGCAAREIVGDAKDFDADVIVMGSRGAVGDPPKVPPDADLRTCSFARRESGLAV
jgi:nucleotide-binding universal stress UspA family protein